jgi:hypothetical protein
MVHKNPTSLHDLCISKVYLNKRGSKINLTVHHATAVRPTVVSLHSYSHATQLQNELQQRKAACLESKTSEVHTLAFVCRKSSV